MGRLPEGRQEAACKKNLKPCPFLHSMVQSNIIEWCKRIKKPVLSRLPATKKLFIFCGIFWSRGEQKAFPYFEIFGEVRPAEKAPGFWTQFYAGNPPRLHSLHNTPRVGYTRARSRQRRRSHTGYRSDRQASQTRSAVDFTRDRQAQPRRKALERIGEAQAGETPAAGALFVRIVRNCMKRRTFQQGNRPRI